MSDSPGVILITGAARRIGLHCAKSLNRHGYKVVISYRHQHPVIDTLNEKGIDCIQADFATVEGVEGFISHVRDHYPKLRAIIHNASDWKKDSSQNQADIFGQMMAVHARAPMLINQQLTSLLNGDKADIIHLTDHVASIGSAKHMAYAASKAALENLTLSFARLLAPKIKVNAIAPALICFNEDDDENYRHKALQKSLLGVAPGEQEVLKAITWLLESDYVTGRIIALDGGRHLNF